MLQLSLYYLGGYVAKEYWIRKGLSTCQHSNLNREESAVSRTNGESGFRTCSEGLFTRSQVSGSIVERDWLCHSNIQGKVYCFYCKLFRTGQNTFITSFNDWKHAREYVVSHESSPNHSTSIKVFLQRSTKQHRTNVQSLKIFVNELKYKKNIHRVVNVVKFFSTPGLAFRGSEETIGSQTNGNFLGIIELISQ